MSMMDYYTQEEAEASLQECLEMKKHFLEKLDELNIFILLLKYYLATGDGLDPSVFGIERPEGFEDDEDE